MGSKTKRATHAMLRRELGGILLKLLDVEFERNGFNYGLITKSF